MYEQRRKERVRLKKISKLKNLAESIAIIALSFENEYGIFDHILSRKLNELIEIARDLISTWDGPVI